MSTLTIKERFNIVVNRAFGGWHHVGEVKHIGENYVRFLYGGDMSTFDFNTLTKLVVACHGVRVRAEIKSGPRRLTFILTPRGDCSESWSAHHPGANDLSEFALEMAREVELWEAEDAP